jgi:3-methylcrotonyl-CoA carboxylase alpha subunit
MKTEFSYEVDGELKAVVVERDGDGFQVTIGDATYAVRAQRPGHGRLNLQIGDRRLRVYVAHDGLRRYVAMGGKTWMLERPKPQQKRRGPGVKGAGSGVVESAMPGLVLDVLVREGDAVEKGQPLVLLSAMKMELRIAAPAGGRVAKVHCAAGQVVERGQVLVEVLE